MIKNQVSINITRYGDQVPKGYPLDTQIVHIYSDSSNLFAALSKAYAKAINALEEWERVAARTDISTNAEELHNGMLYGRMYEENIKLEYYDDLLKMNKELLGYIDNSHLILDVIRNSNDLAEARTNLEIKLGYSQRQIDSILRLRFELFTKTDMERINNEIQKLEKILSNRGT